MSVRGLALAFGLLWAGGIAFAGLVHLAVPSYGTAYLALASSIYPGFHGGRSFGDVLVGTAWGLRHFQGYRTLVASRRVAAPCWSRRLDISASVYSNPENALADGAGGALIFGWIYNLFAGRTTGAGPDL